MGIVTTVRLMVRLLQAAAPPVQRVIDKVQERVDAWHRNSREGARCYRLRQFSQAIPFFEANLKEAERRHYPADHKMYIMLRLAECRRRTGDAEGAEEMAHLATNLAKKEEHILEALDEMSHVKEARGDFETALELARRSYRMTKMGKHSTERLAERCSRLAALEGKHGEKEAVCELLSDAVRLNENAHGTNHPTTASQVASLATALQQQGRYDEALPMFEQAVEVHQAWLGSTAPETLADIEHIGQIYYMQGNFQSAVEHYAKVARLKESVVGLGHTQYASFLMDAATVHVAAGHLGRAIEFLYIARQKAGRDKTLGPLIEERLTHLADQQ